MIQDSCCDREVMELGVIVLAIRSVEDSLPFAVPRLPALQKRRASFSTPRRRRPFPCAPQARAHFPPSHHAHCLVFAKTTQHLGVKSPYLACRRSRTLLAVARLHVRLTAALFAIASLARPAACHSPSQSRYGEESPCVSVGWKLERLQESLHTIV